MKVAINFQLFLFIFTRNLPDERTTLVLNRVLLLLSCKLSDITYLTFHAQAIVRFHIYLQKIS